MDPSALLALVPAQYAVYVAAACGVCAAISMALKPPSATAPAWYKVTYNVINTLGANKFRAVNAAPVVTPKTGV